MNWAKTTAKRDEKHLKLWNLVSDIRDLTVYFVWPHTSLNTYTMIMTDPTLRPGASATGQTATC